MRRIHLIILFFIALSIHAQYTKFVDPKIGSEGLGRVFIGPSMPYGMVNLGQTVCRCQMLVGRKCQKP